MIYNMLKLELKKALCNKLFLLSIFIGCFITMFSFIPSLQSYYRDVNAFKDMQSSSTVVYNTYAPLDSLFNHWIGAEAVSTGSVSFFFLFPILISIPYGWSYCIEKKKGYIRNVVLRCGKLRYYFAKYVAVFVSGGLAMVIPLLFNFILTAMFVPAICPDPTYVTGYGILTSSFMSKILYTNPFLYVFAYFLVDFIFCGLISCMCFAFGAFIKNRVVVVLIPFFALLLFRYICTSYIYISSTTIYKELSPMFFLRPVPAMYDTTGAIIMVEAIILLIFTVCFSIIRGVNDEIY